MNINNTNLYSNILSTIATVSSLIILEILHACFSCSNNFNVSHSSSGSDDKKIVFETPKAVTIKLDDLSNFIGVRSQVVFLFCPPSSNCIYFVKSFPNYLSDKLPRSTL